MKNENNAWLFDLINLLSFYIGVENLGKNDEQINQLEKHLADQDKQYEKIISLLENINKSH